MNNKLLITTSLINSWLYLYKVDEAFYDKAYNDFLNALNKVKTPPNEFMLKGIEFENSCYDLKVDFMKKYVKGAEVQAKKYRNIEVDNQEYLVYGICDLLKGGTIYDIKRVIKYEAPKYQRSSQHLIYFYLFSDCDVFKYLVVDDTLNLHIETYFRNDFNIEANIKYLIKSFVSFLKTHNLYETYKENFKSK